MAEPFDIFLAGALTPPARDPDRAFVAQVQARIALEGRLAANRRAALREFGLQALALSTVAGGLLVLLRSEHVSRLAGQSPGLTLLGLLCAFGLLVALLDNRDGRSIKLNAR